MSLQSRCRSRCSRPGYRHATSWLPELPTPASLTRLLAAGECNDTATIAAIAQLEAAVIALNGAGTQVGVYCLDNPGRRSLLAGATLFGSACPVDLTVVLPPGAVIDPTRPEIQGECIIDPGVSRARLARRA